MLNKEYRVSSRRSGELALEIKTKVEDIVAARGLAKRISAAIHREENRVGVKIGYTISIKVAKKSEPEINEVIQALSKAVNGLVAETEVKAKNNSDAEKRFQENIERYNRQEMTYILTEAMRIFCETNDLAVKLEALKLIAAHTR